MTENWGDERTKNQGSDGLAPRELFFHDQRFWPTAATVGIRPLVTHRADARRCIMQCSASYGFGCKCVFNLTVIPVSRS